MDKLYVSNKDESVRLFKNNFLEKFTHVHWSVPIILYMPVVVFLLGWANKASALTSVLLVLGGIFVWTLTEYVMHRFVFHYQPKSNWGKQLHFLVHGVHHDYPSDSTRLVMPPSASIPLAALFFGLFYLLTPASALPSLFAGFLFGYVCYDCIHYATHHAPMNGRLGRWLKHHHLHHHFRDDERGYGVSSPLWDYVFRTMEKRDDVSSKVQEPPA